MPTPVIEEHQMQPSPPATPSRLGPGGAAAILACTGSRRDHIETTERESGKEEEIVQSNATAAEEPSQPGHCGSSGLGLPQIPEKSTEGRDLIGGGDGAVAEQLAGSDKLRHQEQSVASSNDKEKALGCRLAPSPSAERGATTQGGGSGGASVGLPAGSTVKRGQVDSQPPLMARSTTAAETDCFTYSDGESDGFASSTPAKDAIENPDVLIPNDDAPASPEVVVPVTAVAPRYGAMGGVVQAPSSKQQHHADLRMLSVKSLLLSQEPAASSMAKTTTMVKRYSVTMWQPDMKATNTTMTPRRPTTWGICTQW
ncbi:unnamed protein product [Ectocarpus sp. 8 AP-2014]